MLAPSGRLSVLRGTTVSVTDIDNMMRHQKDRVKDVPNRENFNLESLGKSGLFIAFIIYLILTLLIREVFANSSVKGPATESLSYAVALAATAPVLIIGFAIHVQAAIRRLPRKAYRFGAQLCVALLLIECGVLFLPLMQLGVTIRVFGIEFRLE